MEKTLSIYSLMMISSSLDRLYEQNMNYPINTAYRLMKAKKSVDEAVTYIMERITLICGNDVDLTASNVNGIMMQKISIDVPEIDINDIVSADNVTISLPDVENITLLFTKIGQ